MAAADPTPVLNVWADIFRESDVARRLEAETGKRLSTSVMALLGLAPTAAGLFGAALALGDVRRGRRRPSARTPSAAHPVGA